MKRAAGRFRDKCLKNHDEKKNFQGALKDFTSEQKTPLTPLISSVLNF